MKFSPHYDMSHKVKPNKLMIFPSIVSPLALIAFLKTLMWASWSISFTYVGYWNFQCGNLLVGSIELESISLWREYPWRCQPFIKANRSIKWQSSKWVLIMWSSSWQSSIRRTSRQFSTWLWIWISPYKVVGLEHYYHR
jgi:hypothetical protein